MQCESRRPWPQARADERPTAKQPASVPLARVVGIGASAGGLEALQEFLAPLTPDGTAYVIAQHLAPDHPSLIVELLSRDTALQVLEAVDGEQLAPGVVVIGPPNRDLTVVGDRLRLVEPAERLGPSPNVDLLFESLAQEWGDRSVGVVLSGTGSDGANGLRSLRERRRTDPRAGPRVGAVRRHAPRRHRHGRHRPRRRRRHARRAAGRPDARSADERRTPAHSPTMTRFRRSRRSCKRATGIDFSGYKDSTLRRQVQRRMAIRQIGDIDAYVATLGRTTATRPTPCPATSWSPSPRSSGSRRLRRPARGADDLPRSPGHRRGPARLGPGLRHRRGGLLDRHARQRDPRPAGRPRPSPQDLRDRPGRREPRRRPSRGLSRTSAIARIPEQFRDAYTQETSAGFQIVDALRECTVFARHDVCSDPPFPRIDLVSCRNTLIYFRQPLQDRVIGMFGFALRAGGLLFLGSAENLDRTTSGFRVVDADRRIFRRTERGRSPGIAQSLATRRLGPIDRSSSGSRSVRAPGAADQRTRAAGAVCWRPSCARAARPSWPWTTSIGSSRSSATSAPTAASPRGA